MKTISTATAAAAFILAATASVQQAHAFRTTMPSTHTTNLRSSSFKTTNIRTLQSASTTTALFDNKDTETTPETAKFDEYLENKQLYEATQHLRSSKIEINRERWNAIFDIIEEVTEQAEENAINVRKEEEIPLLSQTRMEMTDMYSALKTNDHLQLFGAIQYPSWPAAGGRTLEPSLLERITGLSMKSLTPKQSNTLLYAGGVLAILEGLISLYLGFDFNTIVFLTVVLAVADRSLLNGAVQETVAKALSPGAQTKITRHEAGHFLCAYLLGCPVEGYVLSSWGALQDNRFGSRGVSAGTSFFDPGLSDQIASNKIKRSSIDRYSVIVMAGIAAEAVHYGQADGGAGDEMALIQFLLQMNGGQPMQTAPWNDLTIRNQARWGALQAVLIIREYKECYDALLDAMERGGTLGDCIYAIEKAGRDHNKLPLQKPLGMIIENSIGGDWTTVIPDQVHDEEATNGANKAAQQQPPAKKFDTEESLEELAGFKKKMEDRLKDIEKELQRFD